jgi:hypothetical protein
MSFERSDLLGPILDDIAANDQILFHGLQQRILGEASTRGMTASSSTIVLIFQAFTDALNERAKKIFSEMERVLDGAYLDDFENLVEELKAEWGRRMTASLSLASSEFSRSTLSLRDRLVQHNLPGETALSDHVERLKLKWFAEIRLLCAKLHDSQSPRLFLKAGEVFAGNRAARAIFTAAKNSLDIIDTYFGPQVFDMFELSQQPVQIRLISHKADAPTRQAYNLFKQQYGRVEFRLCPSKEVHDRFVIIDSKMGLHLGGSIKDLGKSDSQIDAADLDPLRKRFEDLWLKGRPV